MKDIKYRDSETVTGIKLFLGYVGIFLILIGIILLVPLLLLIFYPSETDEYHLFLGPGLASIVIGFILFMFIRKRRKARLQKMQSYLLLLTVWVLSIFIASLPFMLTDKFNFTQAIFEATSGFTTTAESLLNDSELVACTHIFKFYRVWLLFVGGIGLTLILTSAMSDSSSLSIYHLEGHNDRLLPNLIKSSRIIFLIYSIYILIGFGAYKLCKMDTFEAICNSISAISTGGFSIVPGGIGSYNSVPIEVVTEVLMLLGATNFMIHFALLRGKFKNMFYHSELFCFLIMAIIFIPVLSVGFTEAYGTPSEGIRHGVFVFISTTTSSGFSLGDPVEKYHSVSSYLYVSVFICMIVGGQAGSTSGGIKQMRIVQAFKQIFWSIQSLVKSPRLIQPRTIVRYGKRENADMNECRAATSFIFVYISIIFLGTFIFTCFGYSFEQSLYEFTSLLSTTGYSSGIINAAAHPGILWVSTFAMFIGRLEPFIFIMVITRGIDSLSETIHRKSVERKLLKN